MSKARSATIAGALVLTLGTACGGPSKPSVVNEPTLGPDQTPTTTAAPPTTAAPTTELPKTEANVGDTLNLHGYKDGETMAVTVVKVVDPAQAADEFSEPKSGERLVGVQFRLRNTGTATYDDSPSNGAKVIDSQGQNFDSAIADVAAGPRLGSVTITPGSTALGFISFEVPTASHIAKVQFALDSGLAEETGEWIIK